MKTEFYNSQAKLPVVLRGGKVILLPWGRRKVQRGKLPLGGWARLAAIHAGQWDQFMPHAVKIPLKKFMLRDFEGRKHWYSVTHGQWVQGLVAKLNQAQQLPLGVAEQPRWGVLGGRTAILPPNASANSLRVQQIIPGSSSQRELLNQEQRIYIVTVVPERADAIHNSWPRCF